VLVLTREAVPTFDQALRLASGLAQGAYDLWKPKADRGGAVVGHRSEVALCVVAYEQLRRRSGPRGQHALLGAREAGRDPSRQRAPPTVSARVVVEARPLSAGPNTRQRRRHPGNAHLRYPAPLQRPAAVRFTAEHVVTAAKRRLRAAQARADERPSLSTRWGPLTSAAASARVPGRRRQHAARQRRCAGRFVAPQDELGLGCWERYRHPGDCLEEPATETISVPPALPTSTCTTHVCRSCPSSCRTTRSQPPVPRALDVIARLRTWAPTVLVTDGDVIFQPRKVEQSGSAGRRRPRAHLHPQAAGAMTSRRAIRRPLRPDRDKLMILTPVKHAWGSRVTTVFPRCPYA
jgi:hypothetical protein